MSRKKNKKDAYIKDIRRSIRREGRRFLAMAVITTLGVMMFSGLQASCLDLRKSADAFFDRQDLHDLNVVSTLGLTQEDVDALMTVEGVNMAEGIYAEDTSALFGGTLRQIRVENLTASGIDAPCLLEGRMPENNHEVLVTQKFLQETGSKLGDHFLLQEEVEDEAKADTDTDTNADTDPDPYTAADSSTEQDALADPGSDADADSTTEQDADADTDTDTDADADADADTDSDTSLDLELDTDLDTDTPDTEVDDKKDLKEQNFLEPDCCIVGVVIDPRNINNPMGSMSYRSSASDTVIAFVLPTDVKSDYFTSVCLTLDGARDSYCFSSSYKEAVKAVRETIEGGIRIEREAARGQGIRDEAQEKLDEAADEANDKLRSAESKLVKAESQLESAIDQGELELAEGREELASELSCAKEKLESGQEKLDKELAKASKDLAQGQKEIDKARKTLENQKETLEDSRTSLSSGQAELDAGRAELSLQEESVRSQIEGGLQSILSQREELTDKQSLVLEGLDQVKSGLDRLYEEKEKLESQKKELEKGISDLKETISSLEKAIKAAEQAENKSPEEKEEAAGTESAKAVDSKASGKELKAQLSAARASLSELEGKLPALEAGLSEIEGQISPLKKTKKELEDDLAKIKGGLLTLQEEEGKLKEQSSKAEEEFSKAEKKIEGQQKKIDKALTKLESGQEAIASAEKELDKNQKKIDKGLKDYRSGKKDGLKEIADGWSKYESGSIEGEEKLESGSLELEEAKEEAGRQLEEGWSKYHEGSQEAAEQIAQAQAKIDDIGDADWYVQDRTALSGYANLDSDADSIEAIGTVFPIIFFIIAILISLTAITRMVDEDRGLIGTYKSLGFTNQEIRRKYLIFAASACLSGAILGSLCAFVLLPEFLFTIFRIMYLLPDYRLHFYAFYGLTGPLIFLGGILLATLLACRSELKHVPAALMRPKAPRAGSRVLLERIPWFWRRMSFLNKVTIRNLFRYKRRMLMTVLGIAGCMALLLFGFAIKDSVGDLMPRQYEETFHYDVMAAAARDDNDILLSCLSSDERTASYLNIQVDQARIITSDREENVTLMVIPDGPALTKDGYISLTSLDGQELTLTDDQVFITINAANVCSFKAGDPITLRLADLQEAQIPVTTLIKGYLGNYVYMTENTYRKYYEEGGPNAALIHLTGEETPGSAAANGSSEAASAAANLTDSAGSVRFVSYAYSDDLKSQKEIISVTNLHELRDDFSSAFALINAVVTIVIVMSAALAFVVLFTLSTTNISERERELATIKVLGFHDSEVHAYVNKETLLLTLIGILLGLPLGRAFAQTLTFILNLPSIYLAVSLYPISYVISTVLTFAFALAVSLIMNRVLDRIDPVTALKSVE